MITRAEAELDRYLHECGEAERALAMDMRTCFFCGCEFPRQEGKMLYKGGALFGKKYYICDDCLEGEEIGEED